jgi:hypothetical protein
MDTDFAAKAIDVCNETVKQLITVASGVVTISITFLKDLKPTPRERRLLVSSWVMLLLSVVMGILTLQALVGNLGARARAPQAQLFDTNDRWSATLQEVLFLCGLALLMRYGQVWLSRLTLSDDAASGIEPPGAAAEPKQVVERGLWLRRNPRSLSRPLKASRRPTGMREQ